MTSNADYVNWGGTSRKRMNEWVTVDALAVLRAGEALPDEGPCVEDDNAASGGPGRRDATRSLEAVH